MATLAVAPEVSRMDMMPASCREVVKCEHCKMVQYKTITNACRRCKKALSKPEPEALATVRLTQSEPAKEVPPAQSAHGEHTNKPVKWLFAEIFTLHLKCRGITQT
jgi:hypothetical protein